MLALSASDIARTQPSPQELTCIAMTHRIKAITSLNNSVSLGIQSFEQGNAMLAACYVLVSQSAFIGDGLVEYMTFLRGCFVVGIQMGIREMKFLLHSPWRDQNVATTDPSLEITPWIDPESVVACCRSLERFAYLCQRKPQKEMYASILSTSRALFTSSRDGKYLPPVHHVQSSQQRQQL
jgi:hypothetical protein